MARRHPEGHLLSKDTSINDFLTEFQEESDRAAAVLGPAMLDELLKDLLNATFVSRELATKLTGKMMPIGTFSARITLAHAIGLISDPEARDLNRMRDIRNKFAHQLHGLSFDTQAIRDSCSNFVLIAESRHVPTNQGFFEDYPIHARATFNLEVTLMVSKLKARLARARRVQAPSLQVNAPAA